MNPVDRQAWDVGTEQAPLANPIMKLMELLQQLGIGNMGGGTMPPPATTSQQTGPYQGPMWNPSTQQPVAQPSLKQKVTREY